MINNVKKPDISPDFTIEDIHKIREWHYEMYKDMTDEEYMDCLKKEADEVEAQIRAMREEAKQKAEK